MSFLGTLRAPTYKPSKAWFFEDNNVTGIMAMEGYSKALPSMILPRGLSDEQRDLVVWAYERGFTAGSYEGKKKAQREMRDCLGITDGAFL